MVLIDIKFGWLYNLSELLRLGLVPILLKLLHTIESC